MLKQRLVFSRNNLDPQLKEVGFWPQVDTDLLNHEDAQKFNIRKNAVTLYLQGHSTEALRDDTGLSRHEILRLVKRCIKTHKDGRICGFRALVPYYRQKDYCRNSPTLKSESYLYGGRSGELHRLFEQKPNLKELIDDLFLKNRRAGSAQEAHIPLKSIHKRFLDACRNAGIRSNEYPFSTKNLAKVALWKYLKNLILVVGEKAIAARYGEKNARLLKLRNNNILDSQSVSRPYQRVEFDAHLIDAFFTIQVQSVYGGFVELVLDRIWLLAIVEVDSKAILGYHFSFNRQYTSEDVLVCVRNSIVPKTRRNLTIPGLKYDENGGFPSGAFKELEWALWDELAYDNAKSNLSNIVRERLTSTINCAINAGPVATPERRPFIERFFETLEENGFHRLPSTVGNSIKDARRQDPEKKALEFHISLSDLEELTDVLIDQYNGTPHSGIGYRSPLEHLEYYLNTDGFRPRQLPEEERKHLNLLDIRLSRIVRGGLDKGRNPHVNFEGVKYSNDVLSKSYDLSGVKLTLVVDPSDIRSIKAFLPGGAELGILTAQGIWGRTPHTLEMRKAIIGLRIKRLIHYTESDDPIQVYLDYLGKKAPKSRASRRKLASYQHSQRQKLIDSVQNENSAKPIDSRRNVKRSISVDIKPTPKQETSRLKTFTY